MLQPASIRFLKDLRKNNNKEWFEKNRKQYEAAKEDFAQLVQTLIDRFANKDEEIAQLKAKDCTFRINRDVRFSKDKSPYKTNMGASINKGGKKTMTAGYYFHFEPGNSFVGGGLYAPMPEDLKKVRQEIDYSFDEFKEVIGSKKFKAIYGDLNRSNEYSLSRPPKGYEQDNPAIEYLKLKSFVAMTTVSDAELTGKELVKKITDAFEALMPMVKFMHRALEH
ncbi:MAG TPA: DUF2461 domain-containing protein [Panacibacter sp.]|nr:DUF2461 domain-containing protein [Panacibacter sp.]HNP42648.1 DUF2461 domain-containing protein [Panacibacter sp.]